MIESILNPDILDPDNQSQMNISEDSSVLAVLRKPEGKKNPEHVFIVIQDMDGTRMRFLRFDPVQDRAKSEKIKFKIREEFATQKTALMTLQTDILDDETVCGQVWPLYSDDVAKLERMVEKVNLNPANYNLLGRNAKSSQITAASHTGGAIVGTAGLFGESAQKAARAIVTPGDNCFTAIRYLLRESKLHDLNEKLPESKDELIAAIPSLRLTNQSMCEAATEYTKSRCIIL